MLEAGGGDGAATCGGSVTSSCRCIIGRAAMKMTSSTSSTSIIGVMFMSLDTAGTRLMRFTSLR